jgi:hypothetical protein
VNNPQKQAELLRNPIPGIWRAFLNTPLRILTAIAVVGPLLFFFGVMPIVQGMVWATTQGTITTSQVIPNAVSTGYNFALEYQFTADGQTYKGRQLNFDSTSTQAITLSQNDAAALQAKYPKDSSVTVHYDSGLPYNSVLDTQVSTRSLTLFAFAVIFTLIGTPFFALFLRALRWWRLYREVGAMQ